ncbi:PREDICTED: probable sugar phosphate/phosphate translocator At5g04160 [Tarenaya hassleriana]|uniref:probable sugar phosphate/phosphate translocator At5g04160 n=1 Tax=Tarenaya hassleriana TaxID=28532 RepID=UPI00053C5871|nr:PREDICTED: probable sugar phosphate/phosphate translocator At5g04160 [Tarenaya hassleriana]
MPQRKKVYNTTCTRNEGKEATVIEAFKRERKEKKSFIWAFFVDGRGGWELISLSFSSVFSPKESNQIRRQKPDRGSKMSSSSPKKQTLFLSSLIILWYSSNIGVLLLNKFLLSNYGFKFPIFLTMCHMSACSILSYVSIVFLKLVPLQSLKSRSQFLKVSTLSIVFCGSVVGGNISLRYLPVSFNQAVGATTPFFTALFAYIMTFKREAWVTYGALVPVVAGVVVASGGEPSFHWFGFIMCISATAARAFKSVLQGILLSSEGEKLNSMNLLLYMSPIAVIALLPVTLIMEPDVISVTLSLGRQHQYMWVLLLLNSAMAYSANLLNFLVTKHTSALTLQVLGNAKGAVAVVISILLFRNPVTVMGIGGYTITVLGVVAYGETKRRFR